MAQAVLDTHTLQWNSIPDIHGGENKYVCFVEVISRLKMLKFVVILSYVYTGMGVGVTGNKKCS